MRIVPVESAAQLEQIRMLFEEYWTSFGFTPCFQGFAGELKGLPGKYAPPDGGLALAMIEEEPAGCVALRRLDRERGEFKRLYVRTRFRGCGVGRALLAWVVVEARNAGYLEIVGDTVPVMQRALEMYHRAGFERTEPYGDSPTRGAIFFRLRLD